MIGYEEIVTVARELEQQASARAALQELGIDEEAVIKVGAHAALASVKAMQKVDPIVALTALYGAGFIIGFKLAQQQAVEA